MQTLISNLSGKVYQHVIKPVFFSFDAESVHDFMVGNGEVIGKISPVKSLFKSIYSFSDHRLEQTVQGIHFSNPVGLAAGFDYNAQLTQVLSSIGFGFQTIGTITAEAYEGNSKPRLGRLPKSRSLLVNKGYKNLGIQAISTKLEHQRFEVPVGLSIGTTNRLFKDRTEQIQNFIISFEHAEKKLANISHYELNISCPNLKGGEPFTTPERLTPLLQELEKLHIKKPIFIKMPTDLSIDESNGLLKVADRFTVAGAVIGNLTKDRSNPDLVPEEVANMGKGNFSGKPTEKRTNALLAAAYKEFYKRYVFIGCGGIFSAEDAYRKIQLGATLVQCITGMIYQGPQLIGQINKGLIELMDRDGYEHISEAIGQTKS